MDLITRVKNNFAESMQTITLAQEALTDDMVAAGEMLIAGLQNGYKILSCGNGGSASDAEHFTAELVNRLQLERKPLAAITLGTDLATLTSIANDYGYDEIFAKQILALGNKDDILIAISTSGNSQNILQAITTAQSKGLKVIALTGRDGGMVTTLLRHGIDQEIRVPAQSVLRIQETHIFILHCLCDLIDYQLFGKN